MNFKFKIGTKALFGKGCIESNKAVFKEFGRKAFIVTGKKSGKASGALADVVEALKECGVEYRIYDRVLNNPLRKCKERRELES